MQEKADATETTQPKFDETDSNPSTNETTDSSTRNLDDADSRPWAIDEIIAELDREYTGRLPERALREAQRRREEITPRLIELIRAATAQVRAGEKPKAEGYFFALFLLTEFRAKEALPAIFEAITLPGEGPELLFDDVITEMLERTLAAIADDQIELFEQLISDRQVNEYVRWAAAGVYKHLVRNRQMTREDAVERLLRHLRESIANRDGSMVTILVGELSDLGPREALDDIRRAFRLALVDPMFIRMEHIEDNVAQREAWLREALERCRPTGIDDTVEELRTWHCFREEHDPRDDEAPISDSLTDLVDYEEEYDEDAAASDWANDDPWRSSDTIRNTSPPVRRNDPCPCGSGKKYKKCCGAKRD